MKIQLLLCALLSLFTVISQEKTYTNKSLVLRGKASAFVIIEDQYFRNVNLGLEYRFAEHHSFGVDFVYFRWHYEYDIYIDGIETGSGPDAYSRRLYSVVDYRYYPFNTKAENRLDPYINVITKMGKRKIWTNDPETLYGDNDVSSIRKQNASFNDYGLAVGLKVKFGTSQRVGLDASIGAIYRESRIHYQEKYDYQNTAYVESFSGTSHLWKPLMRLNIFVKLFTIQ